MRILKSTPWKRGLLGSHMHFKGYHVKLKNGRQVRYYLRAYDRPAHAAMRRETGHEGFAWYVYIQGAFVPLKNGWAPTFVEAKMRATEAARRDAARRELPKSQGRLYLTKPDDRRFGFIVPRRGHEG